MGLFHKEKTEALDKFKEFNEIVENQSDYHMLKSDVVTT